MLSMNELQDLLDVYDVGNHQLDDLELICREKRPVAFLFKVDYDYFPKIEPIRTNIPCIGDLERVVSDNELAEGVMVDYTDMQWYEKKWKVVG